MPLGAAHKTADLAVRDGHVLGRRSPRPNGLLRQMPSSYGEFTEQFVTRTLWQQSMSIPSRLVSIFRPSMTSCRRRSPGSQTSLRAGS